MKNKKAIPLSLVMEHHRMLRAMAKIGLKIISPRLSQSVYQSWQDIPEVTQKIASPSEKLVNAYIAWSGATLERYQHTLPAHMVSQWGLAISTELMLLTEYNLANVINQGVTLKINGDIPRHQDLILKAKIASITEDLGIARIVVKIITGTQQDPNIVEADLHAAFLLSDFKKSKSLNSLDEISWEQVGSWQTVKNDGLKFALLTGDFNPIYWISLAGKFSAFKQTVLHGFGMFVRTFEALPEVPSEIDIRFLKPIPLPSTKLRVEVSTLRSQEQSRKIRLVGQDERVHLSGHFV